MLEELRSLLHACPDHATREEYASAVIDDNCLGKRTVATRRLSNQRMGELYALAPSVPLFRVMRRLWAADEAGRPVLALLLALARDPLLRVTAPPVLNMRPGEELARQQLTDALRRSVGDRLSEATLDKVVRNAASSWTQSGHLNGRSRKRRQRAGATAMIAAYAMLMGHVLGARGAGLFQTLWAAVLDRDAGELEVLVMDAKRLGLLDVRQAGGVVDVSVARMLADDERRLTHGTD